nr:hypothetical protein [uncultured Oscillibacter sp.]
MKRRNCLWLLLLLCLLSGCGGAAAPAPADSVPAQTLEDSAGLSATRLEAGPRPLMEEEILAAYYRAEEAYGWFDLSPLPDSGETLRLDGTAYRRVDYPGMETVEDLRAYLRSLFSVELTDSLLSLGDGTPYYRDVDGALYVSLSGRERDGGKGASQVGVVPVDSHTYSLEVSVELLNASRDAVAGLECWSFPYAYVDGRWVFTDFQLVS